MTSADQIKTSPAPTRKGRRGKGDTAQRIVLLPDLQAALTETLDLMDGDISGIPSSPEVLPPPELDDDEGLDAIFGTDADDGIGMTVAVTAGGRDRRYRLVRNGLKFDAGTALVEWERDVLGLIAVKKGIDRALADALAFGEDMYGEAAAQVLDDTPFAVQTLYNLASLARRIPRDLRDDTLPFTVQAEVAPLTYPDQKAILEKASEGSLKREEVRDLVRATKRQRQREQAEALPEPARTPPNIEVVQSSATNAVWGNESVDLIITSPPYGVQGDDGRSKYSTPDDWQSWATMIDGFMEEAERILKPGGRLAINVPFDTWVGGQNGGQRNTYGRVLLAGQACGLNYVTTICWNEGNVSKSVARGSLDSPSAPRVMNRQEAILVFCKGEYNRLVDAKERDLTTDLTHEEWLDWTNGTWATPGESSPWEGFEAAFPFEIPYRLIKLFSFREDVICDPFVGSGTTASACWRLGRAGLFSDIDPAQVASTKRRLVKISGTP